MPVDNGEYVEPQEGGIKGALTKPLGPLPLWVWVAVIVGGYFLFRILRGGSGGAVSSGTPTTVGGSSGGDPLGGADAGNLISGMQQDITDLTGKVTDLTGQVNTDNGIIAGLTNLAQLQSTLDQKLSLKTDLVSSINYAYTQLKTYQDALADCTTTACKTKYTNLANDRRTYIDSQKASLATLNTSISGLQSQIVAAQPPTSTATIAAPSTTA